MKRISDARLKSMEADGAKVHRLAPVQGRSESDPVVDMVRQNSAAMQEISSVLSGVSQALSAISTTLKPETIYKDVPVEVPTPIDYDFAVNRDDDGLISTIDLMDGARKAGVATFKRDKDYRVTSITTRSV